MTAVSCVSLVIIVSSHGAIKGFLASASWHCATLTQRWLRHMAKPDLGMHRCWQPQQLHLREHPTVTLTPSQLHVNSYPTYYQNFVFFLINIKKTLLGFKTNPFFHPLLNGHFIWSSGLQGSAGAYPTCQRTKYLFHRRATHWEKQLFTLTCTLTLKTFQLTLHACCCTVGGIWREQTPDKTVTGT